MHRPTMIKIHLYTVYYSKSTMVSTPLTAGKLYFREVASKIALISL